MMQLSPSLGKILLTCVHPNTGKEGFFASKGKSLAQLRGSTLFIHEDAELRLSQVLAAKRVGLSFPKDQVTLVCTLLTVCRNL